MIYTVMILVIKYSSDRIAQFCDFKTFFVFYKKISTDNDKVTIRVMGSENIINMDCL